MEYQRVTERRGANHTLHIILTICTCGIWAITGWPIAAMMGRKTVTQVPVYQPPPQQPNGYPQQPYGQPPQAYGAPPQQPYGQQDPQQYGPPPGPHGEQPPPQQQPRHNGTSWGQQ